MAYYSNFKKADSDEEFDDDEEEFTEKSKDDKQNDFRKICKQEYIQYYSLN